MVPVSSLWLPIVVSAVLVFVVSSVIHMVAGYHAADWKRLPSEDEIQDLLRRLKVAPGDYMVPHARSRAEMTDPDYKARRDRGPLLVLTTWSPGEGMGKSLSLWFLYTVLVGLFSGYVAGAALAPGAPYLSVFRFAGTVAFASYALALLQNSIWYRRDWGSTARSVFDGLIYALLTAGAFGWLWPR